MPRGEPDRSRRSRRRRSRRCGSRRHPVPTVRIPIGRTDRGGRGSRGRCRRPGGSEPDGREADRRSPTAPRDAREPSRRSVRDANPHGLQRERMMAPPCTRDPTPTGRGRTRGTAPAAAASRGSCSRDVDRVRDGRRRPVAVGVAGREAGRVLRAEERVGEEAHASVTLAAAPSRRSRAEEDRPRVRLDGPPGREVPPPEAGKSARTGGP